MVFDDGDRQWHIPADVNFIRVLYQDYLDNPVYNMIKI